MAGITQGCVPSFSPHTEESGSSSYPLHCPKEIPVPISHPEPRSEQNSLRNTDKIKMRVSGGEGARPHPHPRAARPVHLPAKLLHQFLGGPGRNHTSCSVRPCRREPAFRDRPFPWAGWVATIPRGLSEARTEQSLHYPERTARLPQLAHPQ